MSHLHAMLAKQVMGLTGLLLRERLAPKPGLGRTLFGIMRSWLVAATIAAALPAIVYMALGETFPEFVADVRHAGSVAFAEFPRHVFEPLPTSFASETRPPAWKSTMDERVELLGTARDRPPGGVARGVRRSHPLRPGHMRA